MKPSLITRDQADSIARRILEEEREKAEYFRSEEFNQLLGIIQNQELVDHDRLVDGRQEIEGLSAEKFQYLFETVYSVLEGKQQKDGASSFPKYFIDYEGVRFHLLIGQGSDYWTTQIK